MVNKLYVWGAFELPLYLLPERDNYGRFSARAMLNFFIITKITLLYLVCVEGDVGGEDHVLEGGELSKVRVVLEQQNN